MSIAIFSGIVIAAIVCVLVAARRRQRNRAPNTVFYVCLQCERPYAIPDVPRKCRQCGGNVEKMDVPPPREH